MSPMLITERWSAQMGLGGLVKDGTTGHTSAKHPKVDVFLEIISQSSGWKCDKSQSLVSIAQSLLVLIQTCGKDER